MRRFTLITQACAFAAAIVLCGCESRVETVQPKGESAVTLSVDSKGTKQVVKYADRVTITLPPADPAAHRWEISFHDARYSRQLTPFRLPVSGEGVTTVDFVAIRTGTTRIRFVLLPVGNAREATPIDGHDLVLTIE